MLHGNEIDDSGLTYLYDNDPQTGKPRPSLTWWRDYTILDDSFEFNDKDGELKSQRTSLWKEGDMWGLTTFIHFTVTSNQLTIPSLARHHLLSIFTCQAINNNITVPSATSITLDLNRECCLFDSWSKLCYSFCSVLSLSLPIPGYTFFFTSVFPFIPLFSLDAFNSSWDPSLV